MGILLDGFLTGLLLQIAIGPVFFYILQLSLQRSLSDGLAAVLAVTLADYMYIALALMGVGKLLNKDNIKNNLCIISAIVLFLFGFFMIIKSTSSTVTLFDGHNPDSLLYSFMSAFILTVSSPLTILFWTGLFASKAIDNHYQKKQMVYFGMAAGFSTLCFLGGSVLLFAVFKRSIPVSCVTVLNVLVGGILILYAIIRLVRSTR